MKYLLHGDDIASSRIFLNDLILGYEAAVLDGKILSISDLELALVSDSLFTTKEVIVIENLFTRNKNKKKIVEFLNQSQSSRLVILWESKKIIKTSISALKNVIVKEFSLPQVYFDFLDGFAPQRVQHIFQMYHLLLLSTEPTQIFYSLIKRLRALIIIQSGGKALEIEKMQPWQFSKLQMQAKLWSKEKLTDFYRKLQDTEIKLKSGGLPIGLSKHLDLLILSNLR